MNKFDGVTRLLMWLMALFLVALTAGCGGGGASSILGSGSAVSNAVPPTVIAIAPLPNSTAVPVNTKIISAAFSKPMDTATLTPASFTLACGAAGTAGVVGSPKTLVPGGSVTFLPAGNVTTLTLPVANLPATADCTVTITNAVKDSTGLAMLNNYAWNFTTGPLPDTINPRVTLTEPVTSTPAQIGVPVNTAITAAFTEDMAPATINGASFTLTCAAPCVSPAGNVTYTVGSRVATFTPATALAFSTTYTVTVTSAATDLAGNALAGGANPAVAANYVWTFTTGAAPDIIKPRVTLTVPATTTPAQIGVSTNTAISAAFTEEMASATIIAPGTVTVTGPGVTPVAGVVTYASRTMTFTPTTALAFSTTYTVTVTTAATDLAGNALAGGADPAVAANYVWTFTTGVAPDTIKPRVTLTVPATTAPAQTGVATNTAITAAFTEDMAPLTINAASFTVTGPGATPVAGSVSYATRTATFTPTAALAFSTTYTVTVTTAATDLAGNALAGGADPAVAANYVWTFTTGVAPDTTKPRVTLTVPATTVPAQTGVATNTAITAAFTEDMAPLTINAASFTLTGPGVTPVAGGVSYAARTATFTPTTALAFSTTYTATLTTGATDLAGNALAGGVNPAVAANYVWTFTTAAAPVPAANVSVLSTNPGAAALAVCPNASINATFTVPSGLKMDPLTVNTTTVTLTGPGLTPVAAASVALDITGKIATFTPLTALTTGVTYTATIKSGAAGVKDLAVPGNTMLADFTWSFTAGPATVNCPAAPALGAAAPFGFFSSAALTNQGTNPNSIINGDVGTTGVATSITGLHDTLGRTYTETCPSGIAAVGCGLVNGTIYASDAPVGGPAGVVAPAAAAALVAFNAISPAGMPGGLDVTVNSLAGAGGLGNELGGRTLAPGVYYSVAGPGAPAGYQITTGNLTLDAQGNPNAVWVFQTAAGTGTLLVSSPTGPVLTVPRTVNLINGAQAKNVFWYVPAGAVINTGSSMVGTMIGNASITFGTATGANPVIITTLNGRALVLTAGATMVNTVINVPAP